MMSLSGPDDLDRLCLEVDRELGEQRDTSALFTTLFRLARVSPTESPAWVYAHRHLAELLVQSDPWRAALYARRVIARQPNDDGAWAIAGLAQTLLENYRSAVNAYQRALELAPNNPWYAHNLGHLYDIGLDHPRDALPLLKQAMTAQPSEPDIAMSYAHALARCGQLSAAKKVLKRVLRGSATSDQLALLRWINAGAPPGGLKLGELETKDAGDAAPTSPRELA